MANRKFWKVAAGESGVDWEEFRAENCIKIGFGLTSDLNTLITNKSTYKDFRNKTRDINVTDHAAKMLWDFLNNLQIGDVVVIHGGGREIYDLAIVTSSYQFNPHTKNGYWHFRGVEFLNLGSKKFVNAFERRSTIYELNSEKINEILYLYNLNEEKLEAVIKEITKPYKIISNQEEYAKFTPPELIGMEGRRVEVIKRHLYIERDRGFVEKYKQLFIVKQGKTQCQACGFDCEKYYNFGLKAENFLQLHHIEKLANREGTENTETYAKDVVLLCPNCHIAIHRLMEKEDKVISVEELQLHLFPY
jgi:predicted HNH restriction endonuclease